MADKSVLEKPIKELGLSNWTETVLRKEGVETVGDLLSEGGIDIRRIPGIRRVSVDELSRCVWKLLPSLSETDQDNARRFISTLRYSPGEVGLGKIGPKPADLRVILLEFESLCTVASRRIMTHRLGLDGGPRRPLRETAEAFGKSLKAIREVDYVAAGRLTSGSAFTFATEWFLSKLKKHKWLLSLQDLVEELDKSVPLNKGELHASVRLLRRLAGYERSWDYHDGWIMERAFYEKLKTVRRTPPSPPCTVAQFVSAAERELGRKLPEGAAQALLLAHLTFHFDPTGKVIVSIDNEPAIRDWAALYLSRARKPISQKKLLARVEKVMGTKIDPVAFHQSLAVDPRIVKATVRPSYWAWLPKLDLPESELERVKEQCLEILGRGECDRDTLYAQLENPPAQLNAVVLYWLLKRDSRFSMTRDSVGLSG